jgi:ubiquinone/menaquinone biosynthesis C-methylase UbiE
MDRNRFSAIAHRSHLFANPVSLEKLRRVIEMAHPKPGDQVLDVGAGNCELLIRLVQEYGVTGSAVEIAQEQVDEARRRFVGRIDPDAVTLVQEDAAQAVARFRDGQFDLGVCIGSTHALGGLKPTLAALRRCVKPGGYLIVGEGYWKQKPAPEYLGALGTGESELLSHQQNVAAAEQMGLVPMWACTASEDDWDEYEWLYSSSVEQYCQEHPYDPDRAAMLSRIRTWRQTYLTWGRETLGFALYLLRLGQIE